MTGLVRVTHWPVGWIRTGIEVSVVVVGFVAAGEQAITTRASARERARFMANGIAGGGVRFKGRAASRAFDAAGAIRG